DDVVRRAEIASSWEQLFFADRLEAAIAVYRRAYDEIDEAEHPDLHQRLEGELAASAWWDEGALPERRGADGGVRRAHTRRRGRQRRASRRACRLPLPARA